MSVIITQKRVYITLMSTVSERKCIRIFMLCTHRIIQNKNIRGKT